MRLNNILVKDRTAEFNCDLTVRKKAFVLSINRVKTRRKIKAKKFTIIGQILQTNIKYSILFNLFNDLTDNLPIFNILIPLV